MDTVTLDKPSDWKGYGKYDKLNKTQGDRDILFNRLKYTESGDQSFNAGNTEAEGYFANLVFYGSSALNQQYMTWD